VERTPHNSRAQPTTLTATMSHCLSIIGVPFSGGQPKAGVDRAPHELRNAGLIQLIQSAGWKVTHDEEIPIPKQFPEDTFHKAKRHHLVGSVCRQVCAAVSARARAGDFVLTVGGDHSIAAGSIAGILANQPDTFVVWVDAHADINTPEISESGNIHGMPLALLAHLCGKIPGFEYLDDVPPFNLQNLVYIGLRDVDPGEKEIMETRGVQGFYMHDVQSIGITSIMEKVVQYSGNKRIHLSFDVDGIDPEYMPATGTPVGAGLSQQDGEYICKRLASTERVRSFDLVEVNPELGDEQGKRKTLANSLLLVENLLTRQAVINAH